MERIPEFLLRILTECCQPPPWKGPTEYQLVSRLQDAARNHGSVNLMRRLEDGQLLAVKRMPTKWVRSSHHDFTKMHPTSKEAPWVDVGTLRYLQAVQYPYMCNFMGVYVDDTYTYVASSFARGGDLFKWANEDIRPFQKREAALRPIALQVCTAIQYLHNLGIVHRDISVENILLDSGQVKIIDYGMAGWERYSKLARGKPSYAAPEMHLGVHDGFLADAFSVGVVLFVMGYQEYPWMSTKNGQCQGFQYVQANGFRALLEKKKTRTKVKLAGLLTDGFVDLLTGLLCFNPRHRACLGEEAFKDGYRSNTLDSPWWHPTL